MKEGEHISPYVVDLLVKHGVRPESVLLSACCDRSLEDTFEDTFVFLCIDKVHFLTVDYVRKTNKVFNGYISKRDKMTDARENVPCTTKKYVSYKISEIKELKLVNLVASGIAYINFEDDRETQVISAYTNACVGDISKIGRAIEKIKKDGVLNIAEFKDKEDETHCPKCGRPYVDKVRKVCSKCADRKSTFKRLLKMMPKYWKYVAIALLMTIVTSGFNLLIPYMSGTILFDRALKTGNWWSGKVVLIVVLMFLASIASRFISAYSSINMCKMSENVMYDIKSDIFKSFNKMSMGFFTKNNVGSLMTRVNNDTGSVAHFFVNGLPWIIKWIVEFTGGTVLLLSLNPKIVWLGVFPIFTTLVVLKATTKYLRRMYIKSWRASSKMSSAVSDSLRGVKVVKAFGKEQDEIDRFSKLNERAFKISLNTSTTVTLYSPIFSLVMSLVTYGIWIISGREVIMGAGAAVMTYGIMHSSLSYFSMMLAPFTGLSGFMEWWQNCMTAAQRMFDLIDIDPDVKESKTPVVIDKVKGDIEIKNMTFGYEPNQPILKDINVDIKSGEMIGIVGHSGAGKSTLINLVTRMYDANEGEIKIDGYNIKDIAQRTLRDNIALVTQDTYIFQGTVLDNIAYANPEASREDVIAAAKIAKCHDFIEAMPEGYDTMVGAGYRAMSGGERQRVSIARAILINPRILILDEATAALDTETEMSIQNALDSLTKGRTTLAIAHRLSTLRNADRLIVIEDGRITEMGTHGELVKNKGVYYRLMMKQAEALKTKGV